MASFVGTVGFAADTVRAIVALEQCVAGMVRDDRLAMPPYPSIVSKLIKLLRGDDFRLQAVTQLIAKDQAVAAMLIRYANTASWALGSQVQTLPAAVIRLGSAAVQRIVLAATLGGENKLGGALVTLRRRVWRDSILAAHLAEALARGRGLDADEMFIAGLLHDIGKLAAVSAFEKAIETIGAPVIDEETWWAVVERNHVQLGSMLATHWKLPKPLATVIADHHTRQTDGTKDRALALIGAVDAVIDLAEYHTSLSPEILGSAALSLIERQVVAELLPRLAVLVSALENPATEVLPSKVSVPEVAIGAPWREVNAQAHVANPQLPTAMRVVRVGPRGFLVRADGALAAGRLHQLSIQRDQLPALTLWATPHPVEDASHPHAHILKPFVLDGATQASYDAWVRQAS